VRPKRPGQTERAGLSGEIEIVASRDPGCKRLMTVPGIGPIISSAMVAAIGSGAVFSNGRDFGAWLGLVPRHVEPAPIGCQIIDPVHHPIREYVGAFAEDLRPHYCACALKAWPGSVARHYAPSQTSLGSRGSPLANSGRRPPSLA